MGNRSQEDKDSFTAVFAEFYNRFTSIYTKEKLANKNTLLNPSSQAFIVFFPVLIGMLSLVLSPEIPQSSDLAFVRNFQLNLILRNSKIVITFLVIYILIYKFSLIKDNGQYGYWVALGINREKYFIYVNLSLVFNILLGQFFMIIILNIFSPIKMDFINFVTLAMLLFSSTLFLINFTLFLGEFIDNAELASLFALLTYSIIIFFADDESFLQGVFLSEYSYSDSNGFLFFFVQIVFAAVFYFLARNYHLQKDIELGG